MAKPAKRKLPVMPMKKGKMPNKVETKWGSMSKKC